MATGAVIDLGTKDNSTSDGKSKAHAKVTALMTDAAPPTNAAATKRGQ
jgi:hypothetical protein